MSGHSKWATIKRKKGAIDAKRGKIFTKLIREIATAAASAAATRRRQPAPAPGDRQGARRQHAQGQHRARHQEGHRRRRGPSFEEVVYEGYGPGRRRGPGRGLTDNRNRTVGEVRHSFTKHGGNLGAQGCVAHLFEQQGVLVFERPVDADALLEAALEGGRRRRRRGRGRVRRGDRARRASRPCGRARGSGLRADERGDHDAREPRTVRSTGDAAESMLKLAEALEDLDDVQTVYANFDISDEEMREARVARRRGRPRVVARIPICAVPVRPR